MQKRASERACLYGTRKSSRPEIHTAGMQQNVKRRVVPKAGMDSVPIQKILKVLQGLWSAQRFRHVVRIQTQRITNIDSRC